MLGLLLLAARPSIRAGRAAWCPTILNALFVAAMMRGAQTLQIVRIPEQHGIPSMRLDVIGYTGRPDHTIGHAHAT
jgi:hypothetical protein